MNCILFDDKTWQNLLPLTFTRPVAEIRTGIFTMKERWEKFLAQNCSYSTQEYLQKKYPKVVDNDNLMLNASIIPNATLLNQISNLALGEALIHENCPIAARLNNEQVECFDNDFSKYSIKKTDTDFLKINNLWDIFSLNGEVIKTDFAIIKQNRQSAEISKTVNIIGSRENVFFEEGASAEYVTLNANNAFIYVGKDAEIMEGALVRGSLALCEHSALKLGAKIYGPTTIGPHTKVGGEVNNSVFFGYSNKAHDGFLGNSVIGEWCNIGADSNNSNLKNNYAQVRLWNYEKESFVNTGLQFCGLIMGDHSKCGINTMFNTGTVVGVSANIFGSDFPRNFIPSFAWGGAQGFSVYALAKAFEVAEIVMSRRKIELSQIDKNILESVFEKTKKYRKF